MVKDITDNLIRLNNLGTVYFNMHDYPKAEKYFQEALEIWDRIGDKNHPEHATVLNNLGLMYYKLHDNSKAEPLFDQAIKITNNNNNAKNSYKHAGMLNNIALVYSDKGNYSKAEKYFQEALEIWDRIGDKNHPDYANNLYNLGMFFLKRGDYSKVENFIKKSAEIWKKLGGDDTNSDYAMACENLGGVYKIMGDYSKAESLVKTSAEIWKKIGGNNNQEYAVKLSHLGLLYRKTGNYSQALEYFEKALEIWDRIGDEHNLDYALILDDLGLLYRDIGDYSQALEYFEKALEITFKCVGENHHLFTKSLMNIAYLLEIEGNYSEAEYMFQKASEISKTLFGLDHPEYGTSLGNLGELYHRMQEYKKAENFIKQDLKITRKKMGEYNPTYPELLHNLTFVYYDTGDYDKAEQYCKHALEIWKEILDENHPKYGKALIALSLVYAATGRETDAVEALKQSIDIDNRLIGQIFSIGSERQRMEFLSHILDNLHRYLSLIRQHFLSNKEYTYSAFNVVLQRKALGAEALAIQRDAILGGKYPELRTKLKELRSIQMLLARRVMHIDETQRNFQLESKLLNEKREKLEKELAGQIPEIKLEKNSQTVNLMTIAKSLPKETSLVEFIKIDDFDFKAVKSKGEKRRKPSRYLAFILLPEVQDSLKAVDLGNADIIDELVAYFITSISIAGYNRELLDSNLTNARNLLPLSNKLKKDPGVYSNFTGFGYPILKQSNGSELRAKVFDPIINVLGDCKRIMIAPDSDLARLPFEILPNKNGDHRLIDDYQISYLSTGRDLIRFKLSISGSPSDPLVAADPDFNFGNNQYLQHDSNTRGLLFSRLAGTREEGNHIGLLLDVEPLMDRSVLETKLKSCRSPYIMHIATHGFFLPNPFDPTDNDNKNNVTSNIGTGIKPYSISLDKLSNPLLRSGLALAGANSFNQSIELPPEAEDGILTAEDVTSMDLMNTELVVLSACETGLGEIFTGEGVFGLRRSFILAGTQTLVMSLWKVPDEQTKDLMIDFYTRLLSGKGRAESLREAQLAMKKKYPDPYYWGAFICQGNPGPLASELKSIKVKETN
jgi:tetratricopeptide (TPR) repeat protein/CHAT domain-containing protein